LVFLPGAFCSAPFRVSPFAACCFAIFFTVLFPALAGRFISGDAEQGARQRNGYPVTPRLSLSCPLHAGNKTQSVQKTAPLRVKQAANGETRTAILKKKLMKNKIQGEAATPANAGQQSSNRAARVSPYNYNRELSTQTVLGLLKRELPSQYELAEIVGRWIWLDFPARSHRAAANTLYRLGFHWNQRRCVWQHPCGACAPYAAHPQDPREKYGSYFAAAVKPA
jgi:hypothetical protein